MVSRDSGIALDENFDLVIDNSGDVASYSELEEMHKDISGILTSYVKDTVIGGVLTNNNVAEIKADVNSILQNDERVTSVQKISVRRSRDMNRVVLEIEVDSIYGGIQFNV